MNSEVSDYIARSETWPAEMAALRPILLDAGLDESIKWNKPCYSHGDANIVIMQEMKGFLALMFFKGALLADPAGVLESQGPNSRSAKRICIRSVSDVDQLADTITHYVTEAIEVEAAGLEVEPAPAPVFVDELQQRLDTDAAFRHGFESLTPGRQREYHLHFSQAKKVETRVARIEKFADRIVAGKGMRDRVT